MVSTSSLRLPKISERLIELIGPELLRSVSPQDRESLVILAAIAWNLGSCELKQSPEEADTLRQLLEEKPEMGELSDQLVEPMVQRRLALFPDDMRIVVNASVSRHGDQFRVNAAAVCN